MHHPALDTNNDAINDAAASPWLTHLAETILAETTRSLVLTPAAEVYDLALNAEDESYALTVATERVTLRNARATDDAATTLAAQVTKDAAWAPPTTVALPEYRHVPQSGHVKRASFIGQAGSNSNNVWVDPFVKHHIDSWGHIIIDENAYVSDVGLNGYGEGYYDGNATILNLNQSQIVDIYGPGDPNNPESGGDFIRSELQFNHTEVAAGILGQYGNGSLRPQQDMLGQYWERGFLGLELFYRAGTAQYDDQRYPWGISHDGLPLSELQAVTPAKLSPQLTLNDNTAVAENNAILPVDQPVSDVSPPLPASGQPTRAYVMLNQSIAEAAKPTNPMSEGERTSALQQKKAEIHQAQNTTKQNIKDLEAEKNSPFRYFTSWFRTRTPEVIQLDIDAEKRELERLDAEEQGLRSQLQQYGKQQTLDEFGDLAGLSFLDKLRKAVAIAIDKKYLSPTLMEKLADMSREEQIDFLTEKINQEVQNQLINKGIKKLGTKFVPVLGVYSSLMSAQELANLAAKFYELYLEVNDAYTTSMLDAAAKNKVAPVMDDILAGIGNNVPGKLGNLKAGPNGIIPGGAGKIQPIQPNGGAANKTKEVFKNKKKVDNPDEETTAEKAANETERKKQDEENPNNNTPKSKAIRNASLAGKKHPVTGVPFDEDGYPIYESLSDAKLPKDLIGPNVSDTKQFQEATRQFWSEIKDSPLKTQFTKTQLEQIENGDAKIDGFTWHHHQDGETMQLVDEWTHSKTGHSGGRQNTGGRP